MSLKSRRIHSKDRVVPQERHHIQHIRRCERARNRVWHNRHSSSSSSSRSSTAALMMLCTKLQRSCCAGTWRAGMYGHPFMRPFWFFRGICSSPHFAVVPFRPHSDALHVKICGRNFYIFYVRRDSKIWSPRVERWPRLRCFSVDNQPLGRRRDIVHLRSNFQLVVVSAPMAISSVVGGGGGAPIAAAWKVQALSRSGGRHEKTNHDGGDEFRTAQKSITGLGLCAVDDSPATNTASRGRARRARRGSNTGVQEQKQRLEQQPAQRDPSAAVVVVVGADGDIEVEVQQLLYCCSINSLAGILLASYLAELFVNCQRRVSHLRVREIYTSIMSSLCTGTCRLVCFLFCCVHACVFFRNVLHPSVCKRNERLDINIHIVQINKLSLCFRTTASDEARPRWKRVRSASLTSNMPESKHCMIGMCDPRASGGGGRGGQDTLRTLYVARKKTCSTAIRCHLLRLDSIQH